MAIEWFTQFKNLIHYFCIKFMLLYHPYNIDKLINNSVLIIIMHHNNCPISIHCQINEELIISLVKDY